MILTCLIIYVIIDSVTMVPTASLCDGGDCKETVQSLIDRVYPLSLVPRSAWQARPPKENTPLRLPIDLIVIHHSFIPPMCVNRVECSYAMRTMQSMHMDERGWADIGYNFAVGSDGDAYEGRGWLTVGAHALHYNNVSIGICFIGNWNDTLPPRKQLVAVKHLILRGVNQGYISKHYKIIGHRQVRHTECPGETLFESLKKLPHFDPHFKINDNSTNL